LKVTAYQFMFSYLVKFGKKILTLKKIVRNVFKMINETSSFKTELIGNNAKMGRVNQFLDS